MSTILAFQKREIISVITSITNQNPPYSPLIKIPRETEGVTKVSSSGPCHSV